MTRAEKIIDQLKDNPDGLTTSQLVIRTGLSRIAPAVMEARKDYKVKIRTLKVKERFLGLFPRKQAKYKLEN